MDRVVKKLKVPHVPPDLRISSIIFTLVVLYLISRNNYLLFHTLAEGFSIVVAALIYILAEKTHKYSKNSYLLFIGIAFSYIALVDFLHMISYQGMGVFPIFGANTPTQLWIAGRFMEAASLVLASFFFNKKFSSSFVRLVYTALTGFVIYSILWSNIFPVCYIDGKGLTSFKIIGEYVICVILLSAQYYLYIKRKGIHPAVYRMASLSIMFTILSELCFTLYRDVYGIMNFFGHMLKIESFVLLYQGIVQIGIEDPYDLIFAKLRTTAITDPLTNIYNRRYFTQELIKEIERSKLTGSKFSLIMLDIDDFKKINDDHGHAFGDLVLQTAVKMIENRIRKTDVFARWGGEEFMILFPDTAVDEAVAIAEELRRQLSQLEVPRVGRITASFGVTGYTSGDSVDLLIQKADKLMYEAKAAGRNHVRYDQETFFPS